MDQNHRWYFFLQNNHRQFSCVLPNIFLKSFHKVLIFSNFIKNLLIFFNSPSPCPSIVQISYSCNIFQFSRLIEYGHNNFYFELNPALVWAVLDLIFVLDPPVSSYFISQIGVLVNLFYILFAYLNTQLSPLFFILTPSN